MAQTLTAFEKLASACADLSAALTSRSENGTLAQASKPDRMLHSEQPSADSNPSEVERKRVEESSEEREERMNLALDSAGHRHVELEGRSRCSHLGRTDAPAVRIGPGYIPGTYDAFDVLLHPDDRERVKAEVTRTVNDDAPFDTTVSRDLAERRQHPRHQRRGKSLSR
jgi:hypothetical protein